MVPLLVVLVVLPLLVVVVVVVVVLLLELACRAAQLHRPLPRRLPPCRYVGTDGVYTLTTPYERDDKCPICSAGITFEVPPSTTLQQVCAVCVCVRECECVCGWMTLKEQGDSWQPESSPNQRQAGAASAGVAAHPAAPCSSLFPSSLDSRPSRGPF